MGGPHAQTVRAAQRARLRLGPGQDAARVARVDDDSAGAACRQLNGPRDCARTARLAPVLSRHAGGPVRGRALTDCHGLRVKPARGGGHRYEELVAAAALRARARSAAQRRRGALH